MDQSDLDYVEHEKLMVERFGSTRNTKCILAALMIFNKYNINVALNDDQMYTEDDDIDGVKITKEEKEILKYHDWDLDENDGCWYFYLDC